MEFTGEISTIHAFSPEGQICLLILSLLCKSQDNQGGTAFKVFGLTPETPRSILSQENSPGDLEPFTFSHPSLFLRVAALVIKMKG